MTEVPDYVPMLIAGVGKVPSDGGCLVQIANWLVNPDLWTDRPVCVDPILGAWGILVNDGIDGEARRRLALCAPRIAGSRIIDPESEGVVHQSLKHWIEEGAGSGLPFYLHPSGTSFNIYGEPPTLTIHLPSKRLTSTQEYAVQWYEALVAQYEELTACEPVELPRQRWLELKELVGQ